MLNGTINSMVGRRNKVTDIENPTGPCPFFRVHLLQDVYANSKCWWAKAWSALVICILYIYIYSSSTAQGGGGSFKNRKPIGEVGCCESGMAERSHWWTERCLRSPLFLSRSLFFSLFLYLLWLSTYLPTDLSVYLSICLSVYLSIYLSI